MVADKNYMNDKMSIIVKYIYENPDCSFSDLNRALTHYYDSNSNYIRKVMSKKTLRNNLKRLIDLKHVIPHGKRKRKAEEYPDIFTVNREKLKHYPQLKQIIEINETKRINEMNFKLEGLSEEREFIKFNIIFSMLMSYYTDIKIIQSPNAEKFYFSNEIYSMLRTKIQSLLFNYLLNNPDIWYAIKKPEDLDFSIEIKTKWSKNDLFFKMFKDLQNFELKNSKLLQYMKTKTFLKLKSKENDEFYAKAKFDEEKRTQLLKEINNDLINDIDYFKKSKDFDQFTDYYAKKYNKNYSKK